MNKTIIAWVGLILFSSFTLYGETLEELYTMALEQNPEYRSLMLSLENAGIDKEINDLSSGYGLSLSTHETSSTTSTDGGGAVLETGDNGTSLSAAPTAVFSLDEPLETEISASLPLYYNFDNPEDSEYQPGFGIRQPVNDLFGIGANDDELQEAEDRYAIAEAQTNLYEIMFDVQIELLESLEDLLTIRSTIIETQKEILSALEALEELELLQTYDEESYEYRQTHYHLRSLERQLTLSERQYESELKLLSLMTGTEIASIPSIPAATRELRNMEGGALNPDLYLSELGIKVAEISYREEVEGESPEFYLIGDYSLDLDSDGNDSNHDLAGGISAVFENLTLSTSVGYVLDSDPDPYFSTSISWSMPDNRDKRLELAKLTNSLRIAELEQRSAAENLEESRLTLILEAESNAISRANIEEELSILKQQLKEEEISFLNGIGTETAWRSTQYEFAIKELEEKILSVQEHRVELEWEKLNFFHTDFSLHNRTEGL